MPRITLPRNPGLFHVQLSYAGTYIVINDRTGQNEVIIPCRDRAHAEEICRRLNEGEHNGEIWV